MHRIPALANSELTFDKQHAQLVQRFRLGCYQYADYTQLHLLLDASHILFQTTWLRPWKW